MSIYTSDKKIHQDVPGSEWYPRCQGTVHMQISEILIKNLSSNGHLIVKTTGYVFRLPPGDFLQYDSGKKLVMQKHGPIMAVIELRYPVEVTIVYKMNGKLYHISPRTYMSGSVFFTLTDEFTRKLMQNYNHDLWEPSTVESCPREVKDFTMNKQFIRPTASVPDFNKGPESYFYMQSPYYRLAMQQVDNNYYRDKHMGEIGE